MGPEQPAAELKPMYRKFLLLLSMFLPWPCKRFILTGGVGFHLHPTARIGFSWLGAEHIIMKEGSRIGHLNMIKGLRRLHLHAHARLGLLNWVTAQPRQGGPHFQGEGERRPDLIVEEGAAITGRHFIDCSNTVTVGAFSIVAGNRSQIYTHSVDIVESRQATRPVRIGHHCFIGAGCILLPGSVVPDNSVVGAMSLVNKDLRESYILYAGAPAVARKRLDPEQTAFFKRTQGWVD